MNIIEERKNHKNLSLKMKLHPKEIKRFRPSFLHE